MAELSLEDFWKLSWHWTAAGEELAGEELAGEELAGEELAGDAPPVCLIPVEPPTAIGIASRICTVMSPFHRFILHCILL